MKDADGHSPQFRVWCDMYKINHTQPIERVKEQTAKGYLTPEEYEEITGEKYEQ